MRVVFYPRDPNPYQDLLARALGPHGVSVEYLAMPTPSQTANVLLMPVTLLAARFRGARVLHLHWVHQFAVPVAGRWPGVRRAMQLWFVAVLWWAGAIGMRVVWTAHNVLPHQRVFADDVAARRALLRRARQVIVHGELVERQLSAFGVPLPPVTVAPHGPYTGWYPATTSSADAVRSRHALPAGVPVLLFFGRVSEGKGVEDLVSAFGELVSDGAAADAVLLVAGECTDPALADRLGAAADRIHGRVVLELRRVPDTEVAGLIGAATAVVLPFRQVTTSGSAVLALSMGAVVVVPDVEALGDLPDVACVRYPAGRPDGLREALGRVVSTPATVLVTAGAAGRAQVEQRGWGESAARTAAAYRAALSSRPVTAAAAADDGVRREPAAMTGSGS